MTFKQTGLSRVVPIAVWVFCVLACADAIIEGTASFAVHTIVALAAVALAVWIILYSPNLGVDADGITMVNPIRVVHVPFGALIELRVGAAVSVLAKYAGDRERKIVSWNAPGVPRRQPVRNVGGIGGPGAAGMVTGRNSLPVPPPRRKDQGSEVAIAVEGLRSQWEQAHPGDDSTAVATITVRWREWAVLGLLVLLNVAIRLR
ncbi:MAG: hypothetical protein QOJ72_518 [Nocardioidaceae bacterium]|jgi:hypothetical protein|nr:hypothetical protein [Nocardioidaceae bacterium]